MHVTEILLDAVDRGEIPRELEWAIVREHLAAICPVCAEALAAHGFGLGRTRRPQGPVDPVGYQGRRLGLGERELQAKGRTAGRWVREIVRLEPGQRLGRIRGAYSRFQGAIFGALLLKEARRAVPENPEESLSLAEAALVSCRETNPEEPDPEVLAPALAVRGNAKRALGRLREAEEDLDEARLLLDARGFAEPYVPAEVHSYLGSLRKDQGRFDAASRLLRRAATLYGLLGDVERRARVLLKLGAMFYSCQEFASAIEATREAVKLLEDGPHRELSAYACFNLAHHLHAAGEADEAERVLEEHGEVLAAGGDYVARHVVWLRARIAWTRGDVELAERLFTEVRGLTVERGIPFDTSLVSLELALVYLAQGRTARVKELAREALEVFAEQEVEREVRTALALVEAAAAREALTREVVERAISALQRAASRGGS